MGWGWLQCLSSPLLLRRGREGESSLPESLPPALQEPGSNLGAVLDIPLSGLFPPRPRGKQHVFFALPSLLAQPKQKRALFLLGFLLLGLLVVPGGPPCPFALAACSICQRGGQLTVLGGAQFPQTVLGLVPLAMQLVQQLDQGKRRGQQQNDSSDGDALGGVGGERRGEATQWRRGSPGGGTSQKECPQTPPSRHLSQVNWQKLYSTSQRNKGCGEKSRPASTQQRSPALPTAWSRESKQAPREQRLSTCKSLTRLLNRTRVPQLLKD